MARRIWLTRLSTWDTATLMDSVAAAQINLAAAGSDAVIEEAAGDKGYHAAATIELCDFLGVRTYIPEPKLPQPAAWADQPEEQRRAAMNNRRRMKRTAQGEGDAASAERGGRADVRARV
jgi:hypothetical protein